jgi:hypothetical protein
MCRFRFLRSSTTTLGAAVVALVLAGCSAGAPRGDCVPNPPRGGLGSICGFSNPEDVEVVRDAALVVVSEMHFAGRPGDGSLAAIPLEAGDIPPRRLWPSPDARIEAAKPAGDPACTTPPAKLWPHGLTSALAEGILRLAVVNHGERESVELFDVMGSGAYARLVWRGCVPLPPETSGNDVSIAPDGEIVVSNFLDEPPTDRSTSTMLTMMGAALFGRATGDLLGWTRGGGWRHVPGTSAALPNGVAVSKDGGAIFYAESGRSRVVRVPRAGRPGGEPEAITLEGSPDNLSWTPRGTLLVASHTGTLTFMRCAFGRSPCRSSWVVHEIDPERFTAAEVFRHDGAVVGAVATAAEGNGRQFFGSVYDDRIGVRRGN